MNSAVFGHILRHFRSGGRGIFVELNEQVAPAIIDARVVEPILLIQFVFQPAIHAQRRGIGFSHVGDFLVKKDVASVHLLVTIVTGSGLADGESGKAGALRFTAAEIVKLAGLLVAAFLGWCVAGGQPRNAPKN